MNTFARGDDSTCSQATASAFLFISISILDGCREEASFASVDGGPVKLQGDRVHA